MIHFVNVEKGYAGAHAWNEVIKRVNMTIPTDRRIGVLGYNGSGKSTFLRMVAGTEEPDVGHIVRDCNVSWPLGFGGGVHPDMTGVDNAAFIARLYQADLDRVLRFVRDFTEMDDYLDMPVRTYSSGMRAKLNFAISMAIDFDCYLVDEITGVGDATFQAKARRVFAERAQNAGLLFVSHNMSTVKQYCDAALVIESGYIFGFSDINQAHKFYKRIGDERKAQRQQEPELLK
jgi:capsular polysaccharide transport system ATP-binding protein